MTEHGGSGQGASKPASGKGKKRRPSWMSAGEDAAAGSSADPTAARSRTQAAPADHASDQRPGGAATATRTRPASGEPLSPGHDESPGAAREPDEQAYETARAINRESEARRTFRSPPGGLRQRISDTLSGVLEWAGENKLWVGVVAGGLILAIFAFNALTGGEGGGSGSRESGQRSAQESQGAGVDGPVEATGITLSGLEQGEDGAVTLESGELSWEGEIESGEEGETLALEGPTVAEFERGFVLPQASISSGVFAVAQDGGPTIHVNTHTYVSGDTEITQGSIFAVEDDELTASGYYRDEREGSSETVVRTYMDPGGENYRVSFEAPPDTPVPMLVGWRGPAGADATGESGQEGGG